MNRLTQRPVTVRVLYPATHQPTMVLFDCCQFANLLVVLSLTPGSLVQTPGMIHEMAGGQAPQSATRLLATAPPVGLAAHGLAFGVFAVKTCPTTPGVLAAARKALPGFPRPVLALSPQIAHHQATVRAAFDVGFKRCGAGCLCW